MTDPTRNQPPVLRVDKLSKRFGGVRAVANVSLDVAPGTITGVIGPNGSGKSTLFNLLTGVARADSGSVHFGDTDITRLSPDRINRLGIGRTFQLTRLFGKMSARENLVVVSRHDGTLRPEDDQIARKIAPIVGFDHVP